MKREYEDYLRDMLENAEKALSFVEGLDYDGFCKDDKAMYAVIRAFEIIGEAARQIPQGDDVEDGMVMVDDLQQRKLISFWRMEHTNNHKRIWR